MDCPRCSSAQQTGRYCSQCGLILGRVCGQCGTINDQSARYCGSCGAVVVRAPNEPSRLDRSGERKRMTVLFADLVGSFSLIGGDPEDASGLLEDVLERLHRAVAICGGTVAQEAGD